MERPVSNQKWQIICTLLCTFVAAVIRFSRLGVINKLVFDETYYVKDAYSLMHLGYEGKWGQNKDFLFNSGDFSALSPSPAFVVHPPLGKYLIGIGGNLFGWDSPFGWRFMAALFGTLLVLLTCVIAGRLFASVPTTALAGSFVAFDGVAVSLSRTSLLDVFLAVFVLAAFLAVVLDFQHNAHRILALAVESPFEGIFFRPYLICAGLACGAACAVKWSGIWVLACLGMGVFAYEVALRLRVRQSATSVAGAVTAGGIPAFVQLVPVAFVVYMASWANWFFGAGGWNSHAKGNKLQNWLSYQSQVYDFHVGLTKSHVYQANALQWIFDLRPTSFAYQKPYGGEGDYLVRAVLAMGNPALWWIGLVALVWLVYAAVRYRRFSYALVLLGYVSTWVPWFLYWHRTIFMFYTVVLVPFISLAVAAFIRFLWRAGTRSSLVGLVSKTLAAMAVAAISACGLFFLPLATGMLIPHSHWQMRMWLQSWI
ncbi:MAG: phospholipid carrier-dependent glycosyltransferase [Winkia neuii]|uniref:dolichyl-phosphate-mannose--protein mannosyltransferase n=1 Tax=Winkia neuii TaxID=33007 RepID=UPI00041599E8|nr:phospholipid carrier-dependent glycosyltransferase [Winkia neuii]MDK8099156.1 phospholipid carrier-dependent glycosyltransferase [Winkia neuii]MDU3134792.1 phospholipid carrier-dependent glycosyltransferase [Winkia neuii]